MKRKPILIAAIIIVVIALAAPTQALHCNGEIITITTPAATLYIDDRSDETGEINHWLYLESNGIEGLQSGTDHVCLDYCWFVDPCAHAKPDTLII